MTVVFIDLKAAFDSVDRDSNKRDEGKGYKRRIGEKDRRNSKGNKK